MAAPADPADATDEVAWNSFAHTDFFQSPGGIVQLPPTEPIKTGVAIVYGGLTIAKTLVDPGGEAAGVEFVIAFECSVTPEGGDPVVVSQGTVTLAGGDRTDVPGVPAGATCLVWEPDTQGLISNAPSRDEALSIDIPIDGTVGSATAEIINTTEEALPPTTTTTTTTTTRPRRRARRRRSPVPPPPPDRERRPRRRSRWAAQGAVAARCRPPVPTPPAGWPSPPCSSASERWPSAPSAAVASEFRPGRGSSESASR